jgi:uncharacterized membrane protein YdjX (TVP38/TMEM64 family)
MHMPPESAAGDHSAHSPRRRALRNWGLTILVAVFVFVLVRRFGIQEPLRQGLDWVRQLGPWGALVFVGICVVAAVCLVPGSVLTLGAGAIYGATWGTVYASLGSTLGAVAAFLVSRYLLRERFLRRLEENPRWLALDKAVAEEGWKIVCLTRLSPILPYILLNYAFGVSQVKLSHYWTASWVGMLPATVMYAYLGSLAQAAGGRTRSPTQWIFYAGGLVATIAVTIVMARLARRALGQKLG